MSVASSSSLWQIARRPRWILALLLALAIAAGFALLGQWQLSRSFESAAPPDMATETIVPLDTVSRPQQPVPAAATGQRVTLSATFVPDDYIVLSDRINLVAPGFWVVAHGLTPEGDSVAVALGWASSAERATRVVASLRDRTDEETITGRYLPTESPIESDFEAGAMSALAVPQLINEWATSPTGVYGGYVVSDNPPSGLDAIDSPQPITEVPLNLLNIFYAIEWVFFAGFAIYLWFRLVKDVWERERAEAVEAGEGEGGSATVPAPHPTVE